jgi:hypothetical protein
MTGYLNYGGANEIVIDAENVEVTQVSRWASNYKPNVDNSVKQNMGKGDREFLVKGLAISLTELGRLKTLIEATTATTFRAAVTNNADVNVIILSYKVGDAQGQLSGGHWLAVEIRLREST